MTVRILSERRLFLLVGSWLRLLGSSCVCWNLSKVLELGSKRARPREVPTLNAKKIKKSEIFMYTGSVEPSLVEDNI